MNWNRSSKVAIALLVLLLAAAAPAAAVSVSAQNAPDAAEVGQKQTVTFTFTELYTDYDQWTLRGQTQLTDVTWTVTTYDQTDAKIEQTQYNNRTFGHQISASEDVAEVQVRLEGTTPQVDSWSYDPPQTVTLASFSQTQQGGTSTTLESYETRPYTQQSQQARTSIDQAKETIEQAESQGADVTEAKNLVDNAVSAYNSGNFENAESLANQAQNKASSSMQSAQQTDLLIKVGAGVVVLLLLAGGVYWYLQQRETYDKLG